MTISLMGWCETPISVSLVLVLLPGGESLVAAQWRERYELCRVEKDELLQRCKLTNNNANYDNNHHNNNHGPSGDGVLSGQGTSPFQQLYVELKEEYKEFRGRVLALEKERERKRELRRNGGGEGDKERDKDRDRGRREGGGSSSSSSSGSSSSRIQPYGGGAGSGSGTGAAKHEYIKNLILQYLCCKDPLVRGHMEIAIVQMFRFTGEERNAIEDRKKGEENYEDALLASITNFVSSTFYNTSTTTS